MPQSFEYYRPKTPVEAIALLTRPDLHAAPLIINPKPIAPREAGIDAFIDLSLLGLNNIQKAQNGSIHLGPLVSLQEMVESPILSEGTGQLIKVAATMVAGPGIRNLSSLWGAIQARGGPPEIILALLVLDAQVVLLEAGEKKRTISFQQFYETHNNPPQKGELVLDVWLLPSRAGYGWAMERIARTPGDEAIVAAAAIVEIEKDKIIQVLLAVAGADQLPRRFTKVESLLKRKTFNVKTIQKAAQSVSLQCHPIGDFRGSTEYRRSMAGLVARRSLEKASAQASL